MKPETLEYYAPEGTYTVNWKWVMSVIDFIKDLNDPEVFGFAVTEEVRKEAKRLLKMAE